MANTVIALKRSSSPSVIPSSLQFGELALNYADGKIYYKNTNSYIVEFAPGGGYNFSTVNASGTLLVADAVNDILTIQAGTNITITPDAANDAFTINSTGGGTPGGSDKQVQFNDSGSFGGNASLTFDKTTSTLIVGAASSNTEITANGIVFNDNSVLYNFGQIVALYNNLAMA